MVMHMSKQLTPKNLEQLIEKIEISNNTRPSYTLSAVAWQQILKQYPKQFYIEDNKLLYYGIDVCVLGSQKERNKFFNMVNQLVADGVIYER